MENTFVTVEDIQNNRILNLGFSYPYYANHLEAFVDYVNISARMDPKEVMRDMIGLFGKYGKLSSGYRTAALDFAWSVHQANPQHWNEEEKEDGVGDIYAHLFELCPDLDPIIVEKEIATLGYGMYFVIGMSFAFKEVIEERLNPSICGSMVRFFSQWSRQFDDEIMEEAQEEIEEWIAARTQKNA